jgi:hypothetical protein
VAGLDDLFNSNDDDNAVNKDINEDTSYDSGYGTKERDATITEGIDDCYTAKVDGLRELVQ